jgi:hypothetical protein
MLRREQKLQKLRGKWQKSEGLVQEMREQLEQAKATLESN